MVARRTQPEAGFVVSAELLLIAAILILGTVVGWAKLRDQSAAEIKDSILAVDAWIDNAPTYFQPHAQLWIVAAGVVQPGQSAPLTPPIEESSAGCGPLWNGEGTCVITPKVGVTGPNELVYVQATGEN